MTILRVARPTDDISALLPFYCDGLGLRVLGAFKDHEGFDGVMLGAPSVPYHLEFTHTRGERAGRSPSPDHLLVFYLPERGQWLDAVQRMRNAGFGPVESFNPYWAQDGATFEDPDGYRVVLQCARWEPDPALPGATPSTGQIVLCGEDECNALEAFLVERIYEFNAQATGHFDGRLLGGRLAGESGEIIGAFNGHTWGGCCVIAHLWVDPSRRRRGLGRALLEAAEAEAVRRGCQQVVLSSHSFQAPGFYERLGYRQQAVIRDWPKGHAEILYAKRVS